MDIQLQELLDKIKREGIDVAKKEAESLAAEADRGRARILADAEKEAAAIVGRARLEAAKAEESGRAALAQASRDFLLAFRKELEVMLAAVLRAETVKVYGPEVLAEAIPLVVKSLVDNGTEDLSLLLPPDHLAKLEAMASSLLASRLLAGVTIRPSSEIDAGFKIVEKNGTAYYDFTAETIAELFSTRLNARLAEILRAAAKGM
jgi:V/A-type H+-transporting ATPase subunit E